MIKIVTLKRGFYIEGHAGYADKGFDIVCAAVSILAWSALEAMKKSGVKIVTAENPDKGMLCVVAAEGADGEAFKAIMTTLSAGARLLSKDYSRYVMLAGGIGG